uniref:Uncharacterized protein n=1 Tax=viral metagenome TaxID=1070528 RepID=A0A6H1ZJJ2_9ZZZZ
MKQHISPCNCKTCLKAKQDALDEQAERAEDHHASCLANIVEEIKKLKIKQYSRQLAVDGYNQALKDVIKIIK